MTDKPKTTGELVDAYIKLRDKRDAIKKEHAEALKPYNDALYKLEVHFQQVMDKQGLENLKSESGVAYKSVQSSVTVADWDVFRDYVLEHEAFHLLEKRASKTAVEEVVEETGELPPGLNLSRTIKVNVRRA